eukprot:6580-Pyramimonas_sp.AAC.1
MSTAAQIAFAVASGVNPHSKDERLPRWPLHPSPSAHPWPPSLAAPRSQSVDMAVKGPRILFVHPSYTC